MLGLFLVSASWKTIFPGVGTEACPLGEVVIGICGVVVLGDGVGGVVDTSVCGDVVPGGGAGGPNGERSKKKTRDTAMSNSVRTTISAVWGQWRGDILAGVDGTLTGICDIPPGPGTPPGGVCGIHADGGCAAGEDAGC